MRTCVVALAVVLSAGAGEVARPLSLDQRIPVPGVRGRIDHLAYDSEGGRLFVAALGNNTVEIVDLKAHRRIRSVVGFRKPQGLAWDKTSSRLYVASGDDGAVTVLDGHSFKVLKRTAGLPYADNLRWLQPGSRLLVGYGEGAIAELDRDAKRLREISVGGHPESFQVEPGGDRIFVNVPDRRGVFVLDARAGKLMDGWLLRVEANFPMALDAQNHRLFIAARRPARLLVIGTSGGKTFASFDTAGDADDLFYDARHRRIYVIGGAGHVSVFRQDGPDHYAAAADVPTAPGARTGLFLPDSGLLCVAAPARETGEAAILVYRSE